eukprot:11211466-Lingulodinium_polyedra.AAC.1
MPSSLALRADALEGVLCSTKTSGRDKRVRIRHIYVAREAYIAEPQWLECGYLVWVSPDFNFARDYLVPAPTSDYQA